MFCPATYNIIILKQNKIHQKKGGATNDPAIPGLKTCCLHNIKEGAKKENLGDVIPFSNATDRFELVQCQGRQGLMSSESQSMEKVPEKQCNTIIVLSTHALLA
jgi:hypothetical protein